MLKRVVTTTVITAAAVFGIAVVGIAQDQPGGGGRRGWTIPEGAAKEANPVEASAANIEKGKQIYSKNCERCHGATGKGDGKDAEPDMEPEDLGDPERVSRNPDGVMYYKIWNGRRSPKMPAFKSEGLASDEVWQVIHYIKTFRKS
jgi:mono/diheme cytochrome c family protein